jgi:hypothetical protein
MRQPTPNLGRDRIEIFCGDKPACHRVA